MVASQSREITRNSDKIWPYTSSRSSQVIDLGVNRKPMYDFLLVTNSNFGRTLSCAILFEVKTTKSDLEVIMALRTYVVRIEYCLVLVLSGPDDKCHWLPYTRNTLLAISYNVTITIKAPIHAVGVHAVVLNTWLSVGPCWLLKDFVASRSQPWIQLNLKVWAV